MTYILDTNIVTKILKGKLSIKKKLLNLIIEGNEILINVITYYEIKRGLLDSNAVKKLVIFNQLCREFGLIFLDDRLIFDEAAEIWAMLKKRGKLINDADILIASIAKAKNCILVSNDTDFNRIQGLKVENWST
jgi:tRNA(fMet)-specific endonuclease VapC